MATVMQFGNGACTDAIDRLAVGLHSQQPVAGGGESTPTGGAVEQAAGGDAPAACAAGDDVEPDSGGSLDDLFAKLPPKVDTLKRQRSSEEDAQQGAASVDAGSHRPAKKVRSGSVSEVHASSSHVGDGASGATSTRRKKGKKGKKKRGART